MNDTRGVEELIPTLEFLLRNSFFERIKKLAIAGGFNRDVLLDHFDAGLDDAQKVKSTANQRLNLLTVEPLLRWGLAHSFLDEIDDAQYARVLVRFNQRAKP